MCLGGKSGLRESPGGGNLKTVTVEVWSPGFQISEDTVEGWGLESDTTGQGQQAQIRMQRSQKGKSVAGRACLLGVKEGKGL